MMGAATAPLRKLSMSDTLTTIKELITQNQFDQALTLCLQNTTKLETNPLFHLYLGFIYTQQQKYDLALASFFKTRELDPNIIASYKNIAQIYYITKNPQAQKSLTEALWLDPSDTNVWNFLAQLLAPNTYPTADIVFYTGTPYLEMKFDPEKLQSQGLGGSETAFVAMATALAKLGNKVICFANTPIAKKVAGVYFYPVVEFFAFQKVQPIPVFIASRTIYPFQLGRIGKKNYLWLHDTQGCANQDENISQFDFCIDHYFCLSDFHQAIINNKFNLPAHKFIKTRNGFFTENFITTHPPLRKKHSLIYCSRPERGLNVALAVFKQLQKIDANTTLHVCTYSQNTQLEKDPQLKPYWQDLQQPGILFHGTLAKPDLAKLLQETEICLYPNITLLETSCITAIEAMTAGCVMISSDRGALPETLMNNIGGCLLPYQEDPDLLADALVKAIIALWENPQKLLQLSNSAQNRAQSLFDWNKIAQEWQQIFSDVLKQ